MTDVKPLQVYRTAEGVRATRKSVTTEFSATDWERPFVDAFGDDYVAYRRQWARAGPAWVPPFPLHIDFQLVDACNMRCSFCPRDETVMQAMAATDLLNRGTRMPLAMFKQVIDEGARHGLRAINLGSTAEPLIHPQVAEMVAYARQHGVFDVRIITNGLLLRERLIRQLYDAGLTYLGISIDAWSPETYRAVRRQELSTVIAHAQLALRIRREMGLVFPRVRVSFVNTPATAGEFEAFLQFWQAQVDFVELQDFDDYSAEPSNFTFTCDEPFRRLMVWASGIVGCMAWTSERYPYGRIGEQSIQACWDSAALQALRASFARRDYNEMCLACYGKMATKS